MDKLKELFKQLGGSEDLVNALSEELVRYGEELKEQHNRDFEKRVNAAKKICLEEVQKEKAALARKVSIFLESKLEAIEKASDKQRLQEDTEATNKLKHMRALLEGISIEDNGQSRKLQEAEKRLTRMTKAFNTLKEERDKAVRKANDANSIALKTLQRNRLLESKIKAANTLNESAPAPKKKNDAKKSSGGRKKSKPIVENRNVPARSKTKRTPTNSRSNSKDAVDPRIAGIAAQIEVD